MKAAMQNNKMTVEEVKKNIPNWKARDAELVTGTFENKEERGQKARFNLKLYPGDDFTEYTLEDGKTYTLPLGVALHIHNNCFYKEYGHIPGEVGQYGIRQMANDPRSPVQQQMYAVEKVHRFAFNIAGLRDKDFGFTQQSKIIEVTTENPRK